MRFLAAHGFGTVAEWCQRAGVSRQRVYQYLSTGERIPDHVLAALVAAANERVLVVRVVLGGARANRPLERVAA